MFSYRFDLKTQSFSIWLKWVASDEEKWIPRISESNVELSFEWRSGYMEIERSLNAFICNEGQWIYNIWMKLSSKWSFFIEDNKSIQFQLKSFILRAIGIKLSHFVGPKEVSTVGEIDSRFRLYHVSFFISCQHTEHPQNLNVPEWYLYDYLRLTGTECAYSYNFNAYTYFFPGLNIILWL